MTIDHTAKAIEYLDVAANTHDLQLKQIALTNAQVHATLAVDKQARITNLLTYFSAPASVHDTESDAWLGIHEGLGI
jgi:hypothetical protein